MRYWRVVVLCLGVAAAVAADEEKRAVRTYTNADLARVSPLRSETGVDSEPAPPPEAAATRAGQVPRVASEREWRREADRLRQRQDVLRRQIASLETRIAEQQRKPQSRSLLDPVIEGYRQRIAALQERIRDEESRFMDRARREGALPGWLR